MEAKTKKYEDISKFLLNDILSGKYRVAEKLPSERELAGQYGVAHMTVNKALNGLVSAGYLERVQSVGTFVKDFHHIKTVVAVLYYESDVHALFPLPLQRLMAEAGYILTLFDLERIIESPELLLDYLKKSPPHMLLIEGDDICPAELLKTLSKLTPTVIFYRCEHKEKFDASYLLADAEQSGYLAAQMILKHDRTNITAIIDRALTPQHTDLQYLSGVKRAMKEAGHKSLHVFYRQDFLNGVPEDIVDVICKSNGILAALDYYLVPIIRFASIKNINIPEDLMLVGRGNTPWAEAFNLTSLDLQPLEMIAKLKKILANPKRKVSIKIPASPIYRKSCPNLF